MAYRCTYRTKSGRNFFKFSLVQLSSGEVRIFIDYQPSYGRWRSESGHATHRYGIGSRPYICYEPTLTNRSDAIKVVKVWSENTERYIDTGRFE